MTHWKTTLAGALTALGAYLATVTDPVWITYIGKGLMILGPLVLGFTAADSSVTTPPTPPTILK